MARSTPKGKLSRAAKLRELAQKQLEEARQIEEQLITPTRNKLRDLMYETADKFLRENVGIVTAIKINREELGDEIYRLLNDRLIPKGGRRVSEDNDYTASI